MKPPSVRSDDGSIRYKSKELLAEKKKLRAAKPETSKLTVQQMHGLLKMHDNSTVSNSDMTAKTNDMVRDSSGIINNVTINVDDDADDEDDYDIEDVTSEMIRITVEEEKNFEESTKM